MQIKVASTFFLNKIIEGYMRNDINTNVFIYSAETLLNITVTLKLKQKLPKCNN